MNDNVPFEVSWENADGFRGSFALWTLQGALNMSGVVLSELNGGWIRVTFPCRNEVTFSYPFNEPRNESNSEELTRFAALVNAYREIGR